MDRRRRGRHESGIEADEYAGRKFEDSDDDCGHVDEQWNKNLRHKVNEERKKKPKKAARDGNCSRVVQRCVVSVAVGKKKADNVSGRLFLG
jgi:hypothetical protein